jgi:two-component system cell cycle sensor histidine kinase/response regulator CckA
VRMKPSPAVIADQPARILIVDDERLNRQLLQIMLTPEGFHLTTADSGEEAMAVVAHQPPDLILLDIMMSGMDGYQVSAKIKGNPATRNIPIIMITALDDRNARMLGLSAGAEDFLTKPVDRAELCVRVRKLLRLKAYGEHRDKYSQMLEGEVGSRMADLVEERDRAQRYLDTATVILLALDKDGRITLVNRFACGILGWTEEELLGRDWVDTCLPARIRDEVRRKLDDVRGGDLAVGENNILTRSGEERLIEWHDTVLRDDAGLVTGTFASGTDITERRTLEARLRQTSKMDAIGQLASGVAHDFNNLLTVILGFGEILNADPTIADQSRLDLTEIMNAAHRASRLTKQLLAFSRQQVLNTAPLDMNALITEMTGMLERLIGEHVEITLTLAPNLSPALADRGQLEQVVMNLVVNARDAMPGGGRVSIETADVELGSAFFQFLDEPIVEGHYVMLAVTDTGIGMSKETQRHLFEPFFTTKDAGKGTGLGLSTTYGIVKQSKGYISVDSESARGTTFKVYLPQSNHDVLMQASSAAVTAPVKSAKETVLLVEDEAPVRMLAKRILQGAGYHVLEAANGGDAEKLFALHVDQVELVVTDVVMPGCGGPELFGRLQVRAPALRVLYMSGYTEQSAAHKAGIDRGLPFVQKPFTAAGFLQHVREALDR